MAAPGFLAPGGKCHICRPFLGCNHPLLAPSPSGASGQSPLPEPPVAPPLKRLVSHGSSVTTEIWQSNSDIKSRPSRLIGPCSEVNGKNYGLELLVICKRSIGLLGLRVTVSGTEGPGEGGHHPRRFLQLLLIL
jgi:hypothetical protein